MVARSKKSPGSTSLESTRFLSTFPTEIGWMGILGTGEIVSSIFIGHSSAAAVMKVARQFINDHESDVGPLTLKEHDWIPELRQNLQDYARGSRVDFSKHRLALPPRTAFRDKVLAATRALKYGETITYAGLARRAGHPKAFRAVGTVMSTNRFPIVIPCHRVLAAGGKLGGYTSHLGTCMKQILLDLEQAN